MNHIQISDLQKIKPSESVRFDDRDEFEEDYLGIFFIYRLLLIFNIYGFLYYFFHYNYKYLLGQSLLLLIVIFNLYQIKRQLYSVIMSRFKVFCLDAIHNLILLFVVILFYKYYNFYYKNLFNKYHVMLLSLFVGLFNSVLFPMIFNLQITTQYMALVSFYWGLLLISNFFNQKQIKKL